MARDLWWPALVLIGALSATGCRQLFGIDDTEVTYCHGTGFLEVCLADEPALPVVFATDTVIDTDTSTPCADATDATLCRIAGTSIVINHSTSSFATGWASRSGAMSKTSPMDRFRARMAAGNTVRRAVARARRPR